MSDDEKTTTHPLPTARDLPPDCDLEAPVYTLVWRGMQQLYTQIEQARQHEQAARDEADAAWVVLADEYDHLGRVLANLPADTDDHGLTGTLRRLEQALERQDIEVIAPAGQPYSDEWMAIIDNENVIYQPDITVPHIHEIIVPAVKRQGKVIRVGKAIIALPNDT